MDEKEKRLEIAKAMYPDGTIVRCTSNGKPLTVSRTSNDIHYGYSESIYCGNTVGTDIRLYDHKTRSFAEIVGKEQIKPKYVKNVNPYSIITGQSTFFNISSSQIYLVSDRIPKSNYVNKIVILDEKFNFAEIGTDPNDHLYDIATKEEYLAQLKLSGFPTNGFCRSLDNNLQEYLKNTRQNIDHPAKKDIGIAWSDSSFWFVSNGSGKKEYKLEDLMPFICESPIEQMSYKDMVVDKWYKLNFDSLSHYVKFSKIEGIRGYLDKYGYVNQCKFWSKHDSIRFEQVTSVEEVSIETIIPFLPLGHPDWKTLRPTNPCDEIDLSQEYEFPKQINNPLKLKKDEHKSQRDSCKIQRPNIQIREGYTSRGVSIRSTKSKIQLRSDNSHY